MSRLEDPLSYNYKSVLLHVIPEEISKLNNSSEAFEGRLVFISRSYDDNLNKLNCCPNQKFYQGDEVYVNLNHESKIKVIDTLKDMVLNNNTNTIYIRFSNDQYNVENSKLTINPLKIEAAKKQSLNNLKGPNLSNNLVDSNLSISLSLDSRTNCDSINVLSEEQSRLNRVNNSIIQRSQQPTYVIIRTYNNYNPLELNSYLGGGWSSLPEACSAAKRLINPKDNKNYIQGIDPNQIQILQSTGLKVNAIFNLNGKHLL